MVHPCSRSGTKARDGGFELQLFTHPGCDGRRRHLLFISTSGEHLPDDLIKVAGLPPPDTARALVSRLEQTLWRAPFSG